MASEEKRKCCNCGKEFEVKLPDPYNQNHCSEECWIEDEIIGKDKKNEMPIL